MKRRKATAAPARAAWWLDSEARGWSRPGSTNDAGVFVPALVAEPSDVTRRALEVIAEPLLYELLKLETVSAVDLHRARVTTATAQVARLTDEAARWRTVREHLHAAIVAARPRTANDRQLCDLVVGDEGLETTATSVLGWIADDAGRLERDALRERDGEIVDGVQRWQSAAQPRASRSPKHTTQIARERATMLVDKLGAAGWKRGHVADLIIASQSDWNPPPVTIEPAMRRREAMLERLRNLVDPRSNRRR